MKTFQSLLFVMSICTITFTQPISAQVVISEVYGGGGNSGSIYKNDFIELYNPADSVVSLNECSVQYASATAAGTWKVTYLNGSIAPHGFYLIQEAAGSGGTLDLPFPDAIGVINMSAASGKVALCDTTNALVGANPVSSGIIDLVGFGTANFYEGGGPAFAPSNIKSIERKASFMSTAETMGHAGSEEFSGNAYDSNNNNIDFFVHTPQPQNSVSQTEPFLADYTPPSVDSIHILSAAQIEVFFNEAVDSLSSSTLFNYVLNKALAVVQAQRDTVNIKRIILTIEPLSNNLYTLTVQNVKDAAGNEMAAPMTFSFVFGILTISQARSAGIGTAICVCGVVTVADEFKSLSFIQDTTAAIAVYCPNFTASANVGDLWEVTGILTDYNGLLCIDSLKDTIRVSSDNLLPELKIISVEQAGEAYEGQIVCINGVSFAETGFFTSGTYGNTYHIIDGTARLDVRIPGGSKFEGAAIPAGIINLKGVLGQYYSHYQLMPRYETDLEQLSGPIINTQPAITTLSDSSFTISWTTLTPGHSYVLFGSTPLLGDTTGTSISALVTSHTITVTGRKPGQSYYFQAATINNTGTSFSAVYCVVTTSSQSSGQIDVYFNYSVDGTLGMQPLANGNIDLLTKLLESISHASKSIDLTLYSFDDLNTSLDDVADRVADSLIAAKNRGVVIRVVYNDRETSSPLAKLIAVGIPVQKRNLAGNAGIMHNKFFIFDGRDTTNAADDWVMSGSWNVTDIGTYLDAQNVISIQDQSLARIYTLEFEEMFGSSNYTADPSLARFGPAKLDNTPHFTIIKGTKVEVYFSPSDQTASHIIQALSTANSNIFFSQFDFTRDDIREQIIASKNAGVVVKGIVDQQQGELDVLQSAGVDALQAGHSVVTGLFHHKYAIVDPFDDASDPLVITGSHNWTTSAEVDNDENILIIHSGNIARQFLQEFSERYKESGGLGSITNVEDYKIDKPASYELSQNYPNPFNATTVISYKLTVTSKIVLGIYDILGREVAVLVDEMKPAGTYTVRWDAANFASGMYIYRFQARPTNSGQAGSFVDTKKLVLIK
jgi:phosphatidylserine/phosphatidylglycerophosphate/cardiolipin synthase-like enzyme